MGILCAFRFVGLGHALCMAEIGNLPLRIRKVTPESHTESSAANTLISKDLTIYRRPAAAGNGPCVTCVGRSGCRQPSFQHTSARIARQ